MSAVLVDPTGLPYGSRVLQLSSSAGAGYEAFVAEDVSVNRPTKELKRYNQLGEPSGAVYIEDWTTGTATLQLASGSQIPVVGDTFGEAFDGTNTEIFVLTSVDQPENMDSLKVVNIGFSEVIN